MITSTTQTPDQIGGWYDQFLIRFRARFAALTGPLFKTDAQDLFSIYLGALPETERRHYRCTTCRHFVERFGDLVAIDDNGRTTPALWPDDEADWHGDALRAVRHVVTRARVTGVHVCSERVWGAPETGPWRHMAVFPEHRRIFAGSILSANQKAAEHHEEYGMLCRALATHDADRIRIALKLFRDGSLGRPERFESIAEWMLALHERRAALRGPARNNVTWLAVATAPAGFAHVSNTVLGTVLEDIGAGLSFGAIRAKYNEKMHPLQYQRPTAAPTSGAIARAEKIVSELASAGALRRRFMRPDEPPMIWTPRAAAMPAPPTGVFGHLAPKDPRTPPDVVGRPITITWEKFRRTVLPDAIEMSLYAGHDHMQIVFLVTAADPSAPPIVQWDRPEHRNPTTWYLFHNGTAAIDANILACTWVRIYGVTPLPCAWDSDRASAHHGDGAILLLDGARDMRAERGNTGGGFFPENLRSEYREIRSVMEAHAKGAAIEGAGGPTACGLDLRKQPNPFRQPARVRVRTSLGTSEYMIDRWD